MQSFLEITASDNPKELIDRLTDINVYLARSGKLLADAKAYQDQVTANVYASHMEFISRVPATVAMKFVAAQSVTANQIVTWLDRINRTLVHAGDNNPGPRYPLPSRICTAKERLLINNV